MSKGRLLTTMTTLIAVTVFAVTCTSDDEAVPTPDVFQTIATVERSEFPDAPPLPIIRLRNELGSHDGDRGSGCWPQGGGLSTCADFPPVEGPTPPIGVGVARGESLTVEIEAHANPVLLNANVIEIAAPRARATLNLPPATGTTEGVDSVTLEPSLTTELPLDVDPGVYTVTIFGKWDVGDIFYAFQVEVR